MTRAHAADSVDAATAVTRARRGEVVGAERARLRSTLGAHLYSERLARGWSQQAMADAARVGTATISGLEAGTRRPSDRTTRRLAEAFEQGRDDLTIAVTDLRLRRLAGESMRYLNRRRPPRAARVRLYEQAAEVLAEQDRERAAALPSAAAVVDAVFRGERQADAPRGPAELWPDGFPRVRP